MQVENFIPRQLTNRVTSALNISVSNSAMFNMLCTFFLGLGLLALLHGDITWAFLPIRQSLPKELPLFFGVVAIFFLLLGALARSNLITDRTLIKGHNVKSLLSRIKINSGAFIFILALLFFSDIVERKFSFFVHEGTHTEFLLFGVVVAGTFLVISKRTKAISITPWPVLLGTQVVCTCLFLQYTNGRILFSDDHPAFLYRLLLLRQHFPHIPFYNTDWNAGYSAHEFYPSGVVNVFFLIAPFLYALPKVIPYAMYSLYTWVIPYVYMLIIPWSVYISARLLRFDSDTGRIAAFLSLVSSLAYIEWLLKYGTLGFACSAGLVPITFALAYRLAIDEESPKWQHSIGLLIAASICLRWTLVGIAFIPIALFAISSPRKLLVLSRLSKVLVFVILFAILNTGWMMTFVTASNASRFLSGNTMPGAKVTSDASDYSLSGIASKIDKGAERTREALRKMNPLLLILFIPGVIAISSSKLRAVLGSTIVFLFCVSLFIDPLKPQLELVRLAMVAGFLMTLTSGAALKTLITSYLDQSRERDNKIYKIATMYACLIVLFGALYVSPVSVIAAYQNRGDYVYVFAPKEAQTLSETVSNHGGDGRVFFLGFILHELGSFDYKSQEGGHVAPLPIFTNHQMYAFSYYHRFWGTVDPIPSSFRAKGEEGIEEFLDLVNATSVITFKHEWANYCLARPWYKQVNQEGRFRVFVRDRKTGGYFFRGTGDVKTIPRGLRIQSTDSEVVVKYRYYPKMQIWSSSQPVELFPVKVFDEELGGTRKEEAFFVGVRTKPNAENATKQTPWTVEVGFPE